ncbi:hypothetical protein RMATCC62417_10754 [Rhizopus microsporus]|nr:hypothetical protein RMATCC62417_10754 [Rhizopus microsporus]
MTIAYSITWTVHHQCEQEPLYHLAYECLVDEHLEAPYYLERNLERYILGAWVVVENIQQSSLVQSDVRQYQIADLDPPAHHADSMGGSTPKIIFDTHLAISKSNYERYFCNLYTQALYYLSPLNKGYSPAHAFELFEAIAAHGSQVYQDLNPRTKTLISFAQYRAGRMLYEAEYSEEDDRYSHHQQQGLIYLCDAQKNGNAHAAYILGIYTQERGNLDQACQLYHEAAMAGLVEAKVSFAITVLYHHVSTFKAEDAIKALIEASNQGHSLASFLLAAYYDQEQQFQTAAKYGQRVRLSSASPIYGLTKYVIGIIHLKAGYEDAAFQYIAEAANFTQTDDRGLPIKNTLALRKLGLFFLLGIGTPKKPDVAFQYIKKAADYGDEVANIILGQMLILGLGGTINLMEAAQIFEKYKDSIAAKLSRGLLFMKINPEIAYQEFVSVMNFNPTPYDEKNWNITSIRCEATVRIAIWTFNGIGGAEKNPQYAVQLLQKLSDQYNYPEAHYWLAWAYYEGVLAHDDSTIATKDVNKAFHYFLKGAQMNNVKSLYKVGLMLRDGEVTHPQFQRQDAFQFFFKAAGLNHVEAQTQVGVYYFHGLTPVTRNPETAFEYFSLAARHNNTEAILYLADYFVKSSTLHSSINVKQLYNELNRSASSQNPAAYRMLALVINKLTDPSESYEPILRSSASNHQALWSMYKMAKEESYSNTDVKTRFALHCLWKALELTDHKSGRFICTFIPKMTANDVSRTIEIFQQSEGPNTQKMSVAFAQFLNACGKKSLALKKYLEIARFNNVNETAGWVSRLEAAKLVLLENQGKARSKDMVFNYLQEMVGVNGKNLFLPNFLLARCHEKEIWGDGIEEVVDFVLVVVELEEEVLGWVVVVDDGLALEEATVVVVDGGNTMLLEAGLEGTRVDRVVVAGADEDGGGGGGATVVVVVVVVVDGATVGTITGGVVEADVFDGSFDVLDMSSGSD